MFTRRITDDLTSLVKQIDALVAKNKEKKMCAFVVLLSDHADTDEAKLSELATKHGIKVTPLTVFEGVAGPPNYKIAKDADVTVLMWQRQKVDVNHAFRKDELDQKAIAAVVADTGKILGSSSVLK